MSLHSFNRFKSLIKAKGDCLTLAFPPTLCQWVFVPGELFPSSICRITVDLSRLSKLQNLRHDDFIIV